MCFRSFLHAFAVLNIGFALRNISLVEIMAIAGIRVPVQSFIYSESALQGTLMSRLNTAFKAFSMLLLAVGIGFLFWGRQEDEIGNLLSIACMTLNSIVIALVLKPIFQKVHFTVSIFYANFAVFVVYIPILIFRNEKRQSEEPWYAYFGVFLAFLCFMFR